MSFSKLASEVFKRAVEDYHVVDNVDASCPNPYEIGSLEAQLYNKCIVDIRQWHLEDIIRDPELPLADAIAVKRRIDSSNQMRTDMVEDLDSYFQYRFRDVVPLENATLNTESPAWAIDRLSILWLKLWHMREQSERKDTDAEHRKAALEKLEVLRRQRDDLSTAIDQLLDDIASGRKIMKVYRQMKLYNDPSTNPALYGKKS